MNFKSLAPIILGAFLITSCSTSKTVLPYFNDISEIESGRFESINYATTIQSDDELYISVTSSYPEATAHYNLPLSNPATRDVLTTASSPQVQTYIVDSDGYITMPTIGKIYVKGLTVEDLRNNLSEVIHQDVADAIVRVELINFQVVVAGEVTRPTTIKVDRNRFSILDALSTAGDLTPYGERSNVLVIREEDNGERTFARLNLNSSDILTSPYFYLKQNDYVYVEPNEIRQANAKYNQNNSYKLTVISTIVSASSVIASLVIALTVK